MSARAKILVYAAALLLATFSTFDLHAACVQPVTCVDGECTNDGGPVCDSGDNSALTLYSIPSGDTYFLPSDGGGGSGGFVVSDIGVAINCAMAHYASYNWDSGYTTNKAHVYAWSKSSDPDGPLAYTADPTPPSGYDSWEFGTTDPATLTTTLFEGALEGKHNDFPYIEPSDPLQQVQTFFVGATGLNPFEWQLVVAAHEASHEALGGIPEEVADGYGVDALNYYRSDNGAACQ